MGNIALLEAKKNQVLKKLGLLRLHIVLLSTLRHIRKCLNMSVGGPNGLVRHKTLRGILL